MIALSDCCSRASLSQAMTLELPFKDNVPPPPQSTVRPQSTRFCSSAHRFTRATASTASLYKNSCREETVDKRSQN
jgi:hypothetical protein